MIVEVTTSAELHAALKKDSVTAKLLAGIFELETTGTEAPHLIVTAEAKLTLRALGSSRPHLSAWDSSQPHIEAWESSQPHIEAWDSSQPHIEAWESSQPHIEAWESSQPHVKARDSSQPHIEAYNSSQPHVKAWESSQPHIEAYNSSQPHIEAYNSSQPHIEAYNSSQPHIEARDSSQPHVQAHGYAQLSLDGRVLAKCSARVAVLIRGPAEVEGGQQTRVEIASAADWCDYYNVTVVDGVATLYKGLDDNYRSPHGMSYAPGTIPVARDWDGGITECHYGLHFSPTAQMTRQFYKSATRYAACQVALADMRIPEYTDQYPSKIKARGCCGPCVEVDAYGKPIVEQKTV